MEHCDHVLQEEGYQSLIQAQVQISIGARFCTPGVYAPYFGVQFCIWQTLIVGSSS